MHEGISVFFLLSSQGTLCIFGMNFAMCQFIFYLQWNLQKLIVRRLLLYFFTSEKNFGTCHFLEKKKLKKEFILNFGFLLNNPLTNPKWVKKKSMKKRQFRAQVRRTLCFQGPCGNPHRIQRMWGPYARGPPRPVRSFYFRGMDNSESLPLGASSEGELILSPLSPSHTRTCHTV